MTNQLIPVFAGEINNQSAQLVDARLLHEFLEVVTRFNDWIKDRIKEYGFIENQDFISFTEKSVKPKGGRPSKEYHITLDMGKELSMVERNEKGKQARRYFIECENKLRANHHPEPPRLTTATKAQREPLVKAVRRLVKVSTDKGKILTYENAHSIINLKMGVDSIEELMPEQIPQALTLVGQLLERIVLEGDYIAKGEAEPEPVEPSEKINPQQKQALVDAVHQAFPGWVFKDSCTQHAYNHLRAVFKLQDIADLPADQLPLALSLIADLKKKNWQFLLAINEIRDQYMHDYVDAGAPWTPKLKGKWRKLIGTKLPERPDWQKIKEAIEAK